MNFVPCSARAVLLGVYNDQIAGLASALAEVELRLAGIRYVSEDDYIISQYAAGPMRAMLADLKSARAQVTAQGE